PVGRRRRGCQQSAAVRRFARLALVAACLAGVFVPASPAVHADHAHVATRLAKALAVPHAGVTAALAVDLADGSTIFRRRDTVGLVPASNHKLAVPYPALPLPPPPYPP